MRRLLSLAIAVIIFFLSACGSTAPPTEFAPPGEIVRKALVLQFRHTSDRLSRSLKAEPPKIEIDGINVKSLEPVYVEDLAAYHLRGDYDLSLSSPRQKTTRQHNDFDLYLQRQIEGKSWRLLERTVNPEDSEIQWRSYLID
ncbi:hypothetical protein V0288_12255 [Pannus brasiliensis CCIBt3594]|uniref:Uncharacterized protein n=1 Tax=Pannus brasiliensis CCIBt3594 TaxID=1427578 RepID=A0AAW9QSQ5_9CHRO